MRGAGANTSKRALGTVVHGWRGRAESQARGCTSIAKVLVKPALKSLSAGSQKRRK